MSYGCIVGTATIGTAIYFTVGWAHAKSELKAVSFLLSDEDYEYAVVDVDNITVSVAGSDTTTNVGTKYYYACPYTSTDTTLQWGLYVWRETTATEDDVSYDGSTIPIAEIVAKLAEHSEKGEEATLEALRALRVPETGSNAFFPPVSVRANHIAGFDSDGNPTVGENCAEVAEFYSTKSAAEASATAAAASATAAAASATAASESATAASESADAAATSVTTAATYATEAQSYATSAKTSASAAATSATTAKTAAEETESSVAEIEELLLAAQAAASSLEETIKNAQAGASSSVESSDDLPTSSDDDAPSAGDVAYVEDENALYVYNGTTWVKTVDLSSLVGNVSTTADLPTSGVSTGTVYFVTGECAYYQWDGETWTALLQASSTVIAYTPDATYAVAGVVKLSTQYTIDTSSGYGVIGFDANSRVVVPIAGTDQYGYGVVAPGDIVTVNEYGELVLGKGTTEEAGGVLLSSSATIIADPLEYEYYDNDTAYNDEDYNYYGGRIAMDEDGKIYTRTAQLERFGVVKLGSKFQARHSQPYVVGIGVSGDEDTYGQLMFNLETDGALVYEVEYGSGVAGTATSYHLRACHAGESEDGFGTVCVLGLASSLVESISTPAVYSYTYIDSYVALFTSYIDEINTTLEEHQAAVDLISSIEGMSLFYVTDANGDETNAFYYSNATQSDTLDVKILFAVNPAFSSNLTLTIDSDWVTTDDTASDVYTNGSLSITLAANTTDASRTAAITLTYFSQTTTVYIYQSASSVAADDTSISSSGGEVATSSDSD